MTTSARDPSAFALRSLTPADMHTVLKFMHLADECGLSVSTLYSRLQREGLTASSGAPEPPRTLTLAEVLAGAERAAARVEKWPEWKRELSPSTSSKPKG